MSAWRSQVETEGRGRPWVHTDSAIECALIVKAVFHLSLRATQGLLESVVQLMDIVLPVPNYTDESAPAWTRYAMADCTDEASAARGHRHHRVEGIRCG